MVYIGILALAEYVFKLSVELPDPPLFAMMGVITYGILANVCYTGGWIAELIVLRVWKEKAISFGEIAFSLGMTFSVLLTLSPILLGLLQMIFAIVFHQK